jgi:uncharacterized membrane protein
MNTRSSSKVLVALLLMCAVIGSLAPFNIALAHNEVIASSSTASKVKKPVVRVKPPSTAVTRANSDLKKALTAYTKATARTQAAALNKLVSVAQDREEKMITEARDNPSGFLRSALPATTINQLPQVARDQIEQNVTLTGKLFVSHLDSFDPKSNEPLKHVFSLVDSSSQKTYHLHFDKGEPEDNDNDIVQVSGALIGDEVVVNQGDPQSANSSLRVVQKVQSNMSPVGNKRILALKVRFTNVTSTITDDQINTNLFNGPHSANAYFQESSNNQVSLSGDITQWLDIPYDTSNCQNTYYLWAAAATNKAIELGYNLADYDTRVYYFDKLNVISCGAGGVADPSGAFVFLSNGLNGWPTASNGGAIHEIGHILGMAHAGTLDCGTKSIDDFSQCVYSDYGDQFDVMGQNVSGYNTLNGAHRVEEGWIPDSNIQTVTASGTYTISPLEIAGTSPRLLKISNPNYSTSSRQSYYYIEYRQPIGSDSNLPSQLINGASIIFTPMGDAINTVRLDATPEDSSFYNSPLSDNGTFTDSLNNITIKQLSHNAAGVTLQVTLSPVACVRADPTVVVSPTFQYFNPGYSGGYNVKVTNNDSSSCPASSLTTGTSNLPSNIYTFPNTFTIAAGATQNSSLGMTLPSDYPLNQLVNFSITVQDNYHNVAVPVSFMTGTGTCTTAAPTLSVSPTFNTGTAGQSLNYSVTVTNNDSAGCSGVSNISLSTTSLPTGFTSTTPSISLAQSTSGVVNVAVASPISAANGSYGFNIKATSSSGSSSKPVTYVVNSPICTRSAPTVTVSPTSQTGSPGDTLNYTVIVANKDGAQCGSSTFTVDASGLPAGFTSNTFNVTSAPGSYGSGTLAVTSPSNAVSSTTFTVKANDPNHTASTSATYFVDIPCSTVRVNPTIDISPVTQNGTAGQTLSYSVSVTNNDPSSCGASTFHFDPQFPNGNGANALSSKDISDVTIYPGQTATRTLDVTSVSSLPSGDYQFKLWVYDTAGSRHGSTSYATYSVSSSANRAKGAVRGAQTTIPSLSPEMLGRLKEVAQYFFPTAIFPK